jgi:hypothetical protein
LTARRTGKFEMADLVALAALVSGAAAYALNGNH